LLRLQRVSVPNRHLSSIQDALRHASVYRWTEFDTIRRLAAKRGSSSMEAFDAHPFPEFRFPPAPADRPASRGVRDGGEGAGVRRIAVAVDGSADGSIGAPCGKFVGRVNDRDLKKLRGPGPAGGGR
jgi:hypothetical protein